LEVDIAVTGSGDILRNPANVSTTVHLREDRRSPGVAKTSIDTEYDHRTSDWKCFLQLLALV
jgi:hypothetical protein